jgi:DNA repair protein RadA/Sms
VLTRRAGVKLSDQDIFMNVVGGMTINEPAADLAVAVAITSSYQDKPVRMDTVLIGEIGLSGELRAVSQTAIRLREAAKLGFKRAILPRRLRQGEPLPKEIQAIEVRSLKEALKEALFEEVSTPDATERPVK